MRVKDIKAKVAAKVAKGKAKVAKKCKCRAVKTTAALFTLLAVFVISGCQNPAQRAQTAETSIQIFGGSVSFGSEFVSLAQSNETAGNDAGQVASPTNDIKPKTDVSVGGVGGGAIGAAAVAVRAVADACADGSCGECVGGACSE